MINLIKITLKIDDQQVTTNKYLYVLALEWSQHIHQMKQHSLKTPSHHGKREKGRPHFNGSKEDYWTRPEDKKKPDNDPFVSVSAITCCNIRDDHTVESF